MKKIFFILLIASISTIANAQPQARRTQTAAAATRSNADNMTTRAQLSYPVAMTMSEDVVWRRDVYREIDLNESANAGLYYPEEPVDGKQNLFTNIFKLMLTGKIKVYEYRLDGNEVFNDSARIKPLEFLDNYNIYYERNGGRLKIENSDIPSRDVKAYYLKESAYYDQASATFHKKVIALCPIMKRADDFGDGATPYPLFWVKYDDIAPFLAKHTLMTSDFNNAATMSAADYFTKNQYKGKIYKTTNMLGRSLMQIAGEDEARLSAEQKKIEKEIAEFEKNIFGNQARKDSLDSIRVANADVKANKRAARIKTKEAKSVTKTRTKSSSSSGSSTARVSARRERR